MCGIVAVLSPRPVEREVIDRMRDTIGHRGPDGARTWIGATSAGAIGFGHRRLSIVDLSEAAAQPMFSPDEQLAIVFNGEIYNFVELRRELESSGVRFRTRSDTEVLLAAYAHWGHDCLDRLNGMFAFAIWDARRQELFLARDRFGEKPLFYAQLAGGGLAIASEMKALFQHPEIEPAADETTIASYANGTYYEDGPDTFFRGVRRLDPAHAAVVDAAGDDVRIWRYWTPDYGAVRDDLSTDHVVERFRELLDRSVAMRLRADVPIGTSLSGGLDSSILVCLLAGMHAESPLLTQNTFSGRYELDPTISEGPQIDLVADHAGVHSYGITPEPSRLVEEVERLHWHQEEPFLSASIYMQWCVMRLAAQHSTRVLIDGQGADELLAGYQFYFRSFQLDLLDRREPLRLARETLVFNRRLKRAAAAYPQSRRRFDASIAYGLPALAALWLRRPGVFQGPYEVGVAPARPGYRLRRQVSEALLYNSLPMLLRYADRNGMAFSREPRLPYLDYDLVDFAISLPDTALIRNGWQKYVLRRAAEGVVPRSIQWRADKVGFAAPLDVWLRGPLRDWAYERVFSGDIVDVDGYDEARLRSLWDEHQAGHAEHSWALWRWISLNEWYALLRGGTWDRAHDEGAVPVSQRG